ncbi:MAG: dockerin type I repeat-containing protein [Ruminococcus sp.]|nr:dockerin type I repeat-containing protein [Ruminococcus sp.]
MKKTTKQILAVLLSLSMTVSLVTAIAVSNSAAAVTDDIEGTNHCVEEPSSSEEPDTVEPTTYEDEELEILELYCLLKVTQPDGTERSVSLNQKKPGFSPLFTANVTDLAVSDKPYTAHLDVYSAIYPAEKVNEDEVTFYVRSSGTVHFSADAPSGGLYVSGSGVTLEPEVTYPVSLPSETVWTSTPDTPATSAAAPSDAFLIGDVNGDGRVNVVDASLIQRAAIDLEDFTDLQNTLADVNADGKVSILDVTCVQKYAAEFITEIGKAGKLYIP